MLFQQKAGEISTKTFDEVSNQLVQVLQSLQNKDAEIKKFNEFCEKNKIDYPPKEPSKETIKK